MSDKIPNKPEGILLIMGPKTVLGGYSPSQEAWAMDNWVTGISSCMGTKATGAADTLVIEDEAGAKAEAAATKTARRRRESFAIFKIL
jgi:hypothetical protein